MPEASEVVSDLTGKEKPPPPNTGDIHERSEKRMSGFMKNIQRKAAQEGSNFSQPVPTKGGKPDGAAVAPTPVSPTPAPAVPDIPKVDVPPKPAATPDPPAAAPAAPAKPKDEPQKINYEEESRKHQSRADLAEVKLKSFEGKRVIEEAEYTQLQEAKTQVESFVSDPVGFMLEKTPQLAQQLAMHGDPVKLVEVEVEKFKKQLDATFKSQFGDDWRYDSNDAMSPGTPSFRYNLALNDKVDDVRRQYRTYTEGVSEKMRGAERQKAADVVKFKTDYGFTDDDIARADKIFSEQTVSHYNLLKLALIDDIINKKLGSIPNPPPPAPDLTQHSTAPDLAPPKPVDVSNDGKRMLSRIGPTFAREKSHKK